MNADASTTALSEAPTTRKPSPGDVSVRTALEYEMTLHRDGRRPSSRLVELVEAFKVSPHQLAPPRAVP